MNFLILVPIALCTGAIYCSLESIKPDKPKSGGASPALAAVLWFAAMVSLPLVMGIGKPTMVRHTPNVEVEP